MKEEEQEKTVKVSYLEKTRGWRIMEVEDEKHPPLLQNALRGEK